MALQGPHQGAQKSISTGASDFSTSCSKLASVTSIIPLDAISLSEKVDQMTSYHLVVYALDAGGKGKSQCEKAGTEPRIQRTFPRFRPPLQRKDGAPAADRGKKGKKKALRSV